MSFIGTIWLRITLNYIMNSVSFIFNFSYNVSDPLST